MIVCFLMLGIHDFVPNPHGGDLNSLESLRWYRQRREAYFSKYKRLPEQLLSRGVMIFVQFETVPKPKNS
jgi:hypothetical protein